MKKAFRFLALFLFLTSSLVKGQNAVVDGINYQAIARDASGKELSNTAIGVQLTVRSDSANGAIAYQETHNITTNQFGLFNLVIGKGNIIAGTSLKALSIWGSGNPNFLEVAIDPAGGTNFTSIATSQFQAVPYAFASGIAANAPPGAKSLATMTSEPIGANCPNGGTKIEVGPDVNNNDVLDATEIISFSYVCNGADGAAGATGSVGPMGPAGPAGPAGPKGDTGVAGPIGPTGAPGIPGASLTWKGTFASAPASPALNDAYYNSTDKKSYVWDGTIWNMISQDGIQGLKGDTGVAGPIGPAGAPGTPGASLTWKGTFASAPVSPALNDAYYNSADKKSYVWDGTVWNMISQDGIQGIKGDTGVAGSSITWKGTLATAPAGPLLNDAYYNSTDKKSYVWDGASWSIMSQDGADGALNAWGLSGNAGTSPMSGNFIGTTDSADVVFRMNSKPYLRLSAAGNFQFTNDDLFFLAKPSVKMEVSGTPDLANFKGQLRLFDSGNTGRALNLGFQNSSFAAFIQTQKSGADATFPSLSLQPNAGRVGIGTINPLHKLDVVGVTKTDSLIVSSGAASGYILTSDATGNASWQAPAASTSNWTLSGTDLYNNNAGNVGIGISSPSAKLQVDGDIKIGYANQYYLGAYPGLFYNSGNGSIGLGSTSGNLNLELYSGTATPTAFIDAATGNFGIGTSAPASRLDVAGYASMIGMQSIVSGTGKAGYFQVNNNASSDDALYVTNNGSGTSIFGHNNGESGSAGIFQIQNNTNNANALIAATDGTGQAANFTIFNSISSSPALYVSTSGTGPAAHIDGKISISDGTQAAGYVLTSDAVGNASWQPSSASNAWSTTGNASTVDGTNFIGTTDNVPLNFKVNNIKAGRISPNHQILGYNAAPSMGVNTGGVAIGPFAMFSVTSGIQNTAVGSSALYSNVSGIGNTAIGDAAMRSNTSSNNTAVGLYALYSNVAGANNTALGSNSMTNGTSGSDNTAVGYRALLQATGNDNTAVGSQALNKNTSGSFNTAIGFRSLGNNTTGGANTAIGYDALLNNSIGNWNVAIGESALKLATGNSGVAIGVNSLGNATGTYNTALGDQAGAGITTGSSNVAVGSNSGVNGASGNNNTFLGPGTGLLSTPRNKATAIGYNARVDADNALVLGGTGVDAVNVGVNTTVPSERLDVVGNIKFSGALMPNNNAGASGQVLTSNGPGTAPTWTPPSGGLSGGTNNYLAKWTSPSTLSSSLIYDDGLNVGIGTNLPNYSLQLYNSGTSTSIQLSNANSGSAALDGFIISSNSGNVSLMNRESTPMHLGTNNTGRITILADGNVGIGTNTPGVKLDVIGKTKTDSLMVLAGAQNGHVLTSDVLGNATWQPIPPPPAQPKVAFLAGIHGVTGQTITGATIVDVILTNGTSLVFNDGAGYNATTGEFTAPVNGVYQFNADLQLINGSAASTVYDAMLQIGGGANAARLTGTLSPVFPYQGEVQLSATVKLAAGTKVKIRAASTGSTSYTIDRYESSFSGHLVYPY